MSAGKTNNRPRDPATGDVIDAVPWSVHQAALDENQKLRAQIEDMRKALSDWYGAMVIC